MQTGVKQARYRRGPTRCSEALVRACAVYTACLHCVAPGGVGHDHVCAIFADSAPSNLCEFPIIGDLGISADIC